MGGVRRELVSGSACSVSVDVAAAADCRITSEPSAWSGASWPRPACSDSYAVLWGSGALCPAKAGIEGPQLSAPEKLGYAVANRAETMPEAIDAIDDVLTDRADFEKALAIVRSNRPDLVASN